MKKKHELERLRQLETLQQQLSERRKQKVDREQASMHKQELEILSRTDRSQESELVALKIDVLLQHEIDAAQLSSAAIDRSIADLKIIHTHQNSQQQAMIAAKNAKYFEDCKAADDSERDRLLKDHQLEMMRLKAAGAITLSRAEEALQLQLANRKAKKSAALQEKQEKCLQLLLEAKDRSTVMKELELVKSQNMIEIEFEKKAALAAINIISESESEVKLLREEFKHKAEQVIQNAEHKLADDLSLLESSTFAVDEQRRALLLKVCLICEPLNNYRHL